jgi:hypothetical protein
MSIIKKLDFQDQSKIKDLLEAHNTVRGQSLEDFQNDPYSLLNFSRPDNLIQRHIPQTASEIIKDRQATGIFDNDGSIIAIVLSRKISLYPAWSLNMIISNPSKSLRSRSKSITTLVKWLLSFYEDQYVNECWCAIPLKKYLTYEHFHKYFPGRYSLMHEATVHKGARPYYKLYWTLVGQNLPETDIALIKWSLKPEYRKTENFETLYASFKLS